MDDPRFEGCDEWMVAVDRVLARSEAHPILAAKAIDRDCVLTIAGCEASAASENGTCTASHAQLAELTGLPRSTVLRARLALIELGLMAFAPAPSPHGQVQRVIHHR
ncbi:hypothetical protein [Leifsonia sp. EB34]|uniref:hypothetical protein n=1 Tax=Leifsonia sp. EB34 TaxID=3156303 RepID=UPI0035130FCB